MSKQTVETFIIDMGNVLVHFSHERMCRQIAEVCGLQAQEVRRLLFESGIQWELETGRITENQLHARLEQEARRKVDFEWLIRAASDIFERNPGIEPIIGTLKAGGHRLVLLSNTSFSHFEFVRTQFDVLSAFDEFVVSYKVGAMKPDSAIFEAALAAARCAPERCFYTDDIAEYIAAGRRHGLPAEVYTTPEALRVQLRERGIEV